LKSIEKKPNQSQQHQVAGLNCAKYGGPENKHAQEMVYWRDIPSDSRNPLFLPSPMRNNKQQQEQFLTMEPDEGGFNNMRMAMETAVALAVATGRTLVLPPKMRMYLLGKGQGPKQNILGYSDFYHFDSVATEHSLKIISFKEFLETQTFYDRQTGQRTYPPNNRTDWEGTFDNYQQTKAGAAKPLWEWLRNSVALPLYWDFDTCVVGLPNAPGRTNERFDQYLNTVLERDKAQFGNNWNQRVKSYLNNPVPVDAPEPADRLAEMIAQRKQICQYNETYQNAKIIHGLGEYNTGARLLTHFYAFLFFEDWRHDLWMKRFIRDHLRYVDEIQCAAARIVHKVRDIARNNDGTDANPNGSYDSMHIRRGDFQYKDMHMDAQEIYLNNTKDIIREGRTVYIASDEKNKTYFDPLRAHYKLYFLADFAKEIESVNPNYYGMLDQLVASRGEIFFGAFYSTFTGFINRMRGYHVQKQKREGDYEQGAIPSYYYVPKRLQEFRNVMRSYFPLQPAFWQQEFPIGWRDIDHDVQPHEITSQRRRYQ
jgi:hypothetical protein